MCRSKDNFVPESISKRQQSEWRPFFHNLLIFFIGFVFAVVFTALKVNSEGADSFCKLWRDFPNSFCKDFNTFLFVINLFIPVLLESESLREKTFCVGYGQRRTFLLQISILIGMFCAFGTGAALIYGKFNDVSSLSCWFIILIAWCFGLNFLAVVLKLAVKRRIDLEEEK